MKKNEYLFIKTNSDNGDAEVFKFFGTEREMLNVLLSVAQDIAEEIESDEDEIPESVEEIERNEDNNSWYIGVDSSDGEYSVGIKAVEYDIVKRIC